MPDPSTLIPFVIASAILVLIPGPAVLYIVSTGIGRGRRMALASMLGIETGALFHVAAAAVGLSAVVASSVVAYSVIKYAGGAYLIYLGIKTLRHRDDSNPLKVPGATSARAAFKRGVIVNVLNPKLALFFLAFLPQFVTPDRGLGRDPTRVPGPAVHRRGDRHRRRLCDEFGNDRNSPESQRAFRAGAEQSGRRHLPRAGSDRRCSPGTPSATRLGAGQRGEEAPSSHQA